ncbi:MAG: hypothetical protein K0S35_1233 [Geminicoccaceae bacterium]|jgi:hypothetical protein|nr:hypothetical protein [Geminicoccaceae bacterium]
MLSKLHDALRASGTPDDLAKEAAEQGAQARDLKSDVRLLERMVGFTLAFQVATLFFIWQILLRLPS